MNTLNTHAGSSGAAVDGSLANSQQTERLVAAKAKRKSIERSQSHEGGRLFDSVPAYQTFRMRWREELPCATGVYMRRWYIETPWFSIRLHHWLTGDDTRAHHDHPWDFLTLVLFGGYTDCSADKAERMTLGRLAFRRATHRHTVKVDPGGCWTLLLTGPKLRYWGFWVKDKFVKANKYFLKFRAHQCQ